MWNRVEFKQRGKEAFQKNYIASVLAAFIMVLITSGGASIGTNASDSEGAGMFMAFGTMAMFLLTVFLFNVIEVGGCKFFIENRNSQPKFTKVIDGFQSSFYVNIVVVQLLRMVKTFLWSLLFIVPGIIKMYEYRMIPYILAEHPDIDQKNAFMVSKNMMNGHKMELFILDLSFIGWMFVSALTFGFAGIFYVFPYVQATMAEVFAYNKENYRM